MALTLSGTNGVVGAGFTLDASGASVTAGVGTFGSDTLPCWQHIFSLSFGKRIALQCSHKF